MVPIAKHYRVIDAKVAWRVVEDEAVLLHADNSAYFGLNQTGTILWTRLAQQPMTADQLSAWAVKVFPAAPAGLAGEVSAFLDELVELDLVEGGEPAGAAVSPPDPEVKAALAPAWERPAVERFGELEKLILSGE